jgi:hypothetical protein
MLAMLLSVELILTSVPVAVKSPMLLPNMAAGPVVEIVGWLGAVPLLVQVPLL